MKGSPLTEAVSDNPALEISVLYVEEDARTRDLFSSFLEAQVTQLQTASTGQEGLIAFEHFQPDIVLTNITLPELDGFEMIRAIREASSEVKFIIISDRSEYENLLHAMELGVSSYLLKPIDMSKLITTLRDIADQVLLRRQLLATREVARDAEERLRLALEAARIGWWEWDVPSGEVTCSENKATMIGYSPEEFPKQVYDVTALIHPGDYESAMDAMRLHLTGNRKLYLTRYRIRTKDGGYRWYFDKGRVVERNEDGSPRKLIGTVQDVTDQVAQEEKIVDQARRLQETNTRLTELNRFKEIMTSMIVHDLKNPLGAIINLTEESVNEESRRIIQQAGRQMLNMVLNILDVQKADESRVELRICGHALACIAKAALDSVEFLISEKKLHVENTIPDDLYAEIDRDIIERVLSNLLTNAIKYTPVGGKISLAAAPEADTADPMIRVSVADTGPGIPEADREKIFSRYHQVEARSSGRIRSTGLGLTFCKTMVEAHSGEISVESAPGTGSTFSFTVPAGSAPEEQAPAEETPEIPPLRILLVEDNIVNQAVASGILIRWGHQVIVAGNGAEALETLRGTEFDLVLMDMTMPDMDGLEATRRIRALDSPLNRVPVIALTAGSPEGNRDQCIEGGMNGFATKPFTRSTLYTEIARVLNR
jgi:PAS domain S-box-containing protein